MNIFNTGLWFVSIMETYLNGDLYFGIDQEIVMKVTF